MSEIIGVTDSPTVSFSIHVSQQRVSFTDAVMSLTVLAGSPCMLLIYFGGSTKMWPILNCISLYEDGYGLLF